MPPESSSPSSPASFVCVIGNTWPALASIGFLLLQGKKVHWIVGSGSRLMPPLASLPFDQGAVLWRELCNGLGLMMEAPEEGFFVREFRKHSFYTPDWALSGADEPQHEAQQEKARHHSLWLPELHFTALRECRFRETIWELEQKVRLKLDHFDPAYLKKWDTLPVQKVEYHSARSTWQVYLGSGEELQASYLIYADRWSKISEIEGLPKVPDFYQKRRAVGAIQASFSHALPLAQACQNSFCSTLVRSGAKDLKRKLWGYFSTNGLQSHWTLPITAEETENNQELGRQFRRLKATVQKLLGASSFLPPSSSDPAPSYFSLVTDERFLFEEEAFFADEHVLTTASKLTDVPRAIFLTQAYGLTRALMQAKEPLVY